MNIHEYQAKELLQRYGVPVPDGIVAWTPDEAVAAAGNLPGPVYVVKAQIHAGGRGAGHFADDPDGKGGVRLARSIEDVRAAADAMLSHTLVTKQTGPAGRPVHRVYVEAGCDIARELYLSLLVDRASGRVTVIASTEGGMEIEDVAARQPEKIMRVAVDPAAGMSGYLARRLAYGLGLTGGQIAALGRFLPALYRTFSELDCSIVEINPLVVTGESGIVALDAKISFDDNALFRHPELEKLHDEGGRRPQGTRGCEVQPELRGARWEHRLPGERRRPRHGDDGHHQAVWRCAGELPRCRWRRHQGTRDCGVQDHPVGSECRRHPGQHLRWHHALRCDRRGRGRRCARGQPVGAPGGAAGRHQRALGKEILAKSNLPIIAADNLADAAEKIVRAVQEAA